MNPGREPVDRFLAEIKASGLIPKKGYILELGVGACYDHYALFDEDYYFIPTDKKPIALSEAEILDAENFDDSADFLRERPWFHAILAIEVLEHCAHPLVVLENCYEHLVFNGIVAVTMPFYYRLHETSDCLDYWRITPRGLALLFEEAGFERWFVEARYKGADPEGCPSYVVGWAQRTGLQAEPELKEWKVEIPENWRQLQMAAEERWKSNRNA